MKKEEFYSKQAELGTELAHMSYNELINKYRKTRGRVQRQKNRLRKANLNNRRYVEGLEAKLQKAPTVQSIQKKIERGELTKAQARNQIIRALKPLITTQWAESYTVRGARKIEERLVKTMEAADSEWYLESSDDERTRFWNLYHFLRDTGVITQASNQGDWLVETSAINRYDKYYQDENLVEDEDLGEETGVKRKKDKQGNWLPWGGEQVTKVTEQYKNYLEEIENQAIKDYIAKQNAKSEAKQKKWEENYYANQEDDQYDNSRFLRPDEKNL